VNGHAIAGMSVILRAVTWSQDHVHDHIGIILEHEMMMWFLLNGNNDFLLRCTNGSKRSENDSENEKLKSH